MLERTALALALILLGMAAYLLFQRVHRARATAAVTAVRSTERQRAADRRPAVLYFRTDHCAPCHTQARILDQLAAQYGDRLSIEKIDAAADRGQADRFGVFTVPTTLIVDRQGVVRHANYGLADTRKLEGQVQALLDA
jgi:thioredoxin 1